MAGQLGHGGGCASSQFDPGRKTIVFCDLGMVASNHILTNDWATHYKLNPR